MNYEDLDEYGKAIADAYALAPDDDSKAALLDLYHAHTDVGDAGPPPPKPPVKL